MGDLTDHMNAKMDYDLDHYPGPGGDAPAPREPYTDTKRALRRAVALLEGVRDGLRGTAPGAVAIIERDLPALRAQADK